MFERLGKFLKMSIFLVISFFTRSCTLLETGNASSSRKYRGKSHEKLYIVAALFGRIIL